MYAIVQDGGHQYRMEPGSTYRVQLKSDEPGSSITFGQVAMVGGDATKVGTPFVDGASVEGTVVRHLKGPKIVVAHFRRRKNSKRRAGHRQGFTEVRINTING